MGCCEESKVWFWRVGKANARITKGAKREAYVVPINPKTSHASPLVFTAPVALPIAAIGYITAGTGVRVIDETGRNIELAATGYRHY